MKDFTKVSVPLLLLLQSSFLCMYHFRNHLSEEKLLGTQECKSKDGFLSSIDLSSHKSFWDFLKCCSYKSLYYQVYDIIHISVISCYIGTYIFFSNFFTSSDRSGTWNQIFGKKQSSKKWRKALLNLMTLPKSETQDLGTYIRSITIPILVQLDLFSLIHSFFLSFSYGTWAKKKMDWNVESSVY